MKIYTTEMIPLVEFCARRNWIRQSHTGEFCFVVDVYEIPANQLREIADELDRKTNSQEPK